MAGVENQGADEHGVQWYINGEGQLDIVAADSSPRRRRRVPRCRNCGQPIVMMAFKPHYCCEFCRRGLKPPFPSMVSQESGETRRRGR